MAVVADNRSGCGRDHVAVHAALRGRSRDRFGNGEIVVLGQRVQIGRGAIFHNEVAGTVQGVAGLGHDSFVRVHGLRAKDGVLVATRIDHVPPSDRVVVSGVMARDATGRVAVAGVKLADAVRPRPELATVAGSVHGMAAGRWNAAAGVLEATTVMPSWPSALPVNRISVEGYVLERRGNVLRTDLAEVDVSALPAAMGAAPGDRVVVSGRVARDGTVRAYRIQIEPRLESRTPGERRDEGSASDHDEDDDDRPDSGDDRSGGEHDEVELPSTPEHAESVERPASSGGHDAPERPEAPQTPERPESIETPERPETVERPEAVERRMSSAPRAVERPDIRAPRAVERRMSSRPEQIERVEKVEKPEKPEKADDD